MGYVAPSLWNDEKVRNLPLATKAVFTYLLTGPESLLIPGLINGDSDSLAGPLRASITEVEACLVALITARLVERDRGDRIIRVPNAPRYNAPPNGNVLNAWYKRWLQFTESTLRNAHVASVRSAVELRIAEAMKKKAKKGVVESWREAWDETFGTFNVHDRQRDLFSQAEAGVKPFGKPLKLPQPQLLLGGCDNSAVAVSDDEVATGLARERDQGVKRFPEPSLPDPDPRSLSGSRSQIQIPDPDPASRELEWAVGTSPGNATGADVEACRRLWELQEDLAARTGRPVRYKPADASLRIVAACLANVPMDEPMAMRVLQDYATRSPGYLDGKSNWNVDNVRKQIQLMVSTKRSNGHYFPSSEENYTEGGVEVPELGPGVRQMR